MKPLESCFWKFYCSINNSPGQIVAVTAWKHRNLFHATLYSIAWFVLWQAQYLLYFCAGKNLIYFTLGSNWLSNPQDDWKLEGQAVENCKSFGVHSIRMKKEKQISDFDDSVGFANVAREKSGLTGRQKQSFELRSCGVKTSHAFMAESSMFMLVQLILSTQIGHSQLQLSDHVKIEWCNFNWQLILKFHESN